MAIAPFIHLRNHSAYSVAEGALTSHNIIDLCLKYNMPAAGITDTNNVFGGAEFSKYCCADGVQPIIGTQLDVDFHLPATMCTKDAPYSQLILFAQNESGYHNLIKLLSHAYTENKDLDHPHIPVEDLMNYSENIIALSGGIKGVIGKCFLNNNSELATEKCLQLNEIFKGRFYIELQRHNLPAEKESEPFFLELAYKYDIPIVATNECYFATPDMYLAHDILLCIKDGHFAEDSDRRHETKEHYFKSPDEMVALFNDLPEAISNTLEIAKRCTYFFQKTDPLLPHVEKGTNIELDEKNLATQIPVILDLAHKAETSLEKFWNNYEKKDLNKKLQSDLHDIIETISKPDITLDVAKLKVADLTKISMKFSEAELLTTRAHDGLKLRLEKAGITGPDEQKPYWERLEYELGVIIGMGFPGYFLIVADFIGWAKNHDIPVGPGRGSGAGSIVAWSMKITDLNPLRFNLLFERFLNPERVNMPDFDIDFCEDRRGEVIHYVQEKYGADSVGQIITFGKIKAKNAIKDVGRVLRIPYSNCDELCKVIPAKLRYTNEKGEEKEAEPTLPLCQKYLPEFKDMIENDSEEVLKHLVTNAIQIEGLFKSTGMHAAGVVIGDRPLDELVALYKTDKSDWPVTQYNMKHIEETGLIKYDFLGLKTLTVIKKACDMIKKYRGIDLDINNISMDDPDTYALLMQSNTPAIFQLESKGMQKIILDLKPDKIEDLVALVALYRPGPMDNIPTYVDRKFGRQEIEYDHPKLEPILKETYGIMVYQEQVMEIGKQLAGYTKGMADDLRKAMGKKIKEKMDQHREIFKKGCLEVSGIDESISMKIFDKMAQFASYGFNKSHAVCYAWVCYQTAYLKAHYAPEFMASSMTYEMDDTAKLAFFADNVKQMGIKILPPDINKSFEYFSVEDGNIRYSMAAVKGVGRGVVKSIADEREKNGPYKNITDFVTRVDAKNINRKMLESLIKAGAFDSIEPNRNKMFSNVDYLLSQISSMNKDRENNQSCLFSLDEITTKRDDIRLADAVDWRPLERLNNEREVIGFYISAHPLDIYENTLITMGVKDSSQITTAKNDEKIHLAGIVDSYKKKTSKNGKTYFLVQISDKKGSFEILFFERTAKPQTKPLNPYAQKFAKHKPLPPQSLDEIESILKSGQPVEIFADVKRDESLRITLFGSHIDYLKIQTQVGSDIYIQINDVDAVHTLKTLLFPDKANNALYPELEKLKEKISNKNSINKHENPYILPVGTTSVHIQVIENGKRINIILPEKIGMTMECIELLKVIPGITFHF